jgi:hypothetical protein
VIATQELAMFCGVKNAGEVTDAVAICLCDAGRCVRTVEKGAVVAAYKPFAQTAQRVAREVVQVLVDDEVEIA